MMPVTTVRSRRSFVAALSWPHLGAGVAVTVAAATGLTGAAHANEGAGLPAQDPVFEGHLHADAQGDVARGRSAGVAGDTVQSAWPGIHIGRPVGTCVAKRTVRGAPIAYGSVQGGIPSVGGLGIGLSVRPSVQQRPVGHAPIRITVSGSADGPRRERQNHHSGNRVQAWHGQFCRVQYR